MAITQYLQITPELSGTNAVTMKPAGKERTRFAIPCSTAEPVPGNARFPVVRGGKLEIYGKQGLIMRCPVQPREGAGGKLLFTFELQNDIARNAMFTFHVHRDDGQVGGGQVYAYQLLDFIDPQHRQKQLTKRFEESHKKMLQELKKISPQGISR